MYFSRISVLEVALRNQTAMRKNVQEFSKYSEIFEFKIESHLEFRNPLAFRFYFFGSQEFYRRFSSGVLNFPEPFGVI